MDVPLVDGRTAWEDAAAAHLATGAAGQKTALTGIPAALVAASPNYLGCIDPLGPARTAATNLGALLVAAFDPVAAGLLRTPGEQGADVAVAEGQPFGMPMAFGGPYLGMFAVASEHTRRLPGRLVGRTVDPEGRTAYVTTLRAREQDIRRERASSNICTNQTLIAVGAMVQMAWLGTWGLRELALRCARGTRYARDALIALPGVKPLVDSARCAGVRPRAAASGRPGRRAHGRRRLPGRHTRRSWGPPRPARSRDREAHPGRDRRLRGCHGKGRLVSGLGRKAAPGGKASSAPLLGHDEEPTIFDFSVPGRRSASFRTTGVPEWRAEELLPADELRPEPPELAEISERDLVAHMTRLSHRQYSVDLGAYPLGSCTMKYNPKVCDEAAALPGLGYVHPATPAPYAQGWLELLWDLTNALCRITGMHAATLQPPAGAAGELTGLLIMRAWHQQTGPVADQGADPGLGARDQPGLGKPRRLHHRQHPLGRAGPRQPGGPAPAPRR